MKNFSITLSSEPRVQEFFNNLFSTPQSVFKPLQKEDLIECLVGIFVSTNIIRYGPAPNKESLETIAVAISNCVKKKIPIPILCPWGSKKPKNYESIDIAELMALHMLHMLHTQVKAYYEPGIMVNLRIDDVSGYHLFFDQEGSEASSVRYVNDLLLLIKILDYDFINPITESIFVDKHTFFEFAENVKISFLDYLSSTDQNEFQHIDSLDSWNRLKQLGWSGHIPFEMRNFFKQQYSVMYQGISETKKQELLSRYFAGTVARMHFKATAKDPSWKNNFLQLNFLPAAPGTPFNLISNRLSYRTVPENFGRTHIPPWRAKGFLEIRSDTIKPKVTSWFNTEITYVPSLLTIERDRDSICIKADQKLL